LETKQRLRVNREKSAAAHTPNASSLANVCCTGGRLGICPQEPRPLQAEGARTDSRGNRGVSLVVMCRNSTQS
jgi:hypothetical protein